MKNSKCNKQNTVKTINPQPAIRNPQFILTILIYFFNSTPAHACPLCKDAVEKMGQVWTSLGFNWSIYLMLGIPFLLVAGFSGMLYWNYKKSVGKG